MAQKQLDILPRKGKAGLLNTEQVPSVSELLQSSAEPEKPVKSKRVKSRSISSFSYRERIVHLLAVRSYRKMELQMELDRDGASKRYSQCWTKALGKVATFNPRGNLYTLKEICYKEVNEKWPFYDDRMRDEIRQKLKEIRDQSISPGSSSSSGSSDQGSSTSSQTRKRSTTNDYVVPAKKLRVAHPQKPAMEDTVTLSSHHVTTPKTSVSSQPSVTLAASPQHVAKVDPQFLTVTAPPSVAMVAHKPVPKVSPHPVDKPAHQVDPMVANKPVAYPLDDYITNEELANLSSLYAPITESEQRKKYKAEFEAGSREYNWMYGPTKDSVKAFTKLERKLKAASPSEIEAVKNEIYVSYLKLKNDGEYMSQRAALFRLKKKLDHIRTMIEEYDQRILHQSS